MLKPGVRRQERNGGEVDLHRLRIAFHWQKAPLELPESVQDTCGRLHEIASWLVAERDAQFPNVSDYRHGLLRAMVGDAVFGRYRVVNHDAHDRRTLAPAGTGLDGQPVLMNREYVEADRRIVLGFVEPHFMAGFSGGCKGIFPAVADIGAIMRYHDAQMIGHPQPVLPTVPDLLGRPFKTFREWVQANADAFR